MNPLWKESKPIIKNEMCKFIGEMAKHVTKNNREVLADLTEKFKTNFLLKGGNNNAKLIDEIKVLALDSLVALTKNLPA